MIEEIGTIHVPTRIEAPETLPRVESEVDAPPEPPPAEEGSGDILDIYI